MSDAERWLSARIEQAPAQLRQRMLAALAEVPPELATHDRLAEAAFACLQRATRGSGRREDALQLLTADALLTHACEAAAEAGSETLAAFANALSAQRFEQLLHSSVP
ncbi:MAG: hypothetical protein ACT443_05590 [Gemmatimonadota bacterium]